MRIHARKNSRRADRLTLNLASMIDCTFLLLAYFIVTTIVVSPEDRLSPNLQSERDESAAEDVEGTGPPPSVFTGVLPLSLLVLLVVWLW